MELVIACTKPWGLIPAPPPKAIKHQVLVDTDTCPSPPLKKNKEKSVALNSKRLIPYPPKG